MVLELISSHIAFVTPPPTSRQRQALRGGEWQSVPTYLSRYLAGEYEQVWDELVSLGSAVREEPVMSDASAVARQRMRGAKAHALRLLDRFGRIGYRFAHAPLGTSEPST